MAALQLAHSLGIDLVNLDPYAVLPDGFRSWATQWAESPVPGCRCPRYYIDILPTAPPAAIAEFNGLCPVWQTEWANIPLASPYRVEWSPAPFQLHSFTLYGSNGTAPMGRTWQARTNYGGFVVGGPWPMGGADNGYRVLPLSCLNTTNPTDFPTGLWGWIRPTFWWQKFVNPH